MSSIQLKTEVPGPKSRAMLGSPRVGRSDRPRQSDRCRGRARGRRARARRRRQHVHRLRGRHRRTGRGPLSAHRRRGDARGRRRQLMHMCSLVATYESYVRAVRAAQRGDTRRLPQEDAALEQRRRSGRERGQGGARVHQAAGRHLLRGRVSRPHAADAEPHEQVRPVQERLRPVRAGDRPAADAQCLSAPRRA